jgi:putative SOS response-associated peptidase YedK
MIVPFWIKLVFMCGRYTLTQTDKLKARYDLTKVPKDVHPNFNVAPTQTMPVITAAGDAMQLELMRWGIPRFIGPGKVKDVFNTRADKAFWSWKKLTMTQRILVPATGFYEWKKLSGGKQPYFIHPKDEELFSFAGIWNTWKDEDGKETKTFSIITTDPNEEMLEIHNRMPVILHQEDESAWLSPSNDNDRNTIEALLRPYENDGLELYEVSSDVNVARTNEEYLMYPLNSQ